MATSSMSSCRRTPEAAGELLDMAVTSRWLRCMPLGGFFLARCKFLPVGPGVSFFKWAGFSPEPAGYRYEHRIKRGRELVG